MIQFKLNFQNTETEEVQGGDDIGGLDETDCLDDTADVDKHFFCDVCGLLNESCDCAHDENQEENLPSYGDLDVDDACDFDNRKEGDNEIDLSASMSEVSVMDLDDNSSDLPDVENLAPVFVHPIEKTVSLQTYLCIL